MQYKSVSSEDLKRRLARLEANTSAQTVEEEVSRMAACDAMRSELAARGVEA